MVELTFHSLGDDIWEHCHLVRFYGASLPHRMTVIRLRDGTLVLHSPTRCDEPTRRALAELGQVAHIVAPNGMHDLFIDDYARQFPQARVWIPPGVARYFCHVPNAEALSPGVQNSAWGDDITHFLLEGLPRLNECVFYHSQSKSLIFADFFFNIDRSAPPLIRIAARLGGFYEKLATPADIRWFLVRDRAALLRSIHRLRSFRFHNVIIGHGQNVMGSGCAAFERATAWIQ